MTVEDIINGVLANEGGTYTNDPSDSGGETKWGWTKQALRDMGWFGNVADLTRDTAYDLYYRRFIVKSGYDKVLPLSASICAELVDTSVNMGEAYAGRFLQWALNALNDEQRVYPDIAEDGAVGPGTIKALTKYLSYRGAEGEQVMLKALNCFQGARYLDLAKTSPKNERFVYGWLNSRVNI